MLTPAPSSLSIVMVASEAVPFAKTGGLADVTSSLAKALGRLGHTVKLLMPKYRGVGSVDARGRQLPLVMAGRQFDIRFVEQPIGRGVGAVFVECDELYDRDGLYALRGRDYPDNAVRFALLARAALEYTSQQELRPDVLHAHDWQGGLVPVYARTHYAATLGTIPTMFTIHNVAYQGVFPASVMGPLELDPTLFTVAGLEYWGQVSFLKGGVNFGDVVTTVSEAYAREILTPEMGFGFDGVLQVRRSRLRGILNGVDTDVWNPEHDPLLPVAFSAHDLAGKRVVKRHLLERFGLPSAPADLSRPVVGMISRLVYQKGFDLVAEVLDELPELGATFVVLGTGDAQYEEMWRAAAQRYPTAIGVQIGYDEPLAHLIEAGADIFLMPSRYEPCGLNQMYSMRYGTVPVVRATGGLDDAVVQYDEASGRGSGFKFGEFTAGAMVAALRHAIVLFGDARQWRRIQVEGMTRDFSWTASANAYVREYRALIANQGNGDRGSGNA